MRGRPTAISSIGPSPSPFITLLGVVRGPRLTYFDSMGIQLNDFQRDMIKSLAMFSSRDVPSTGYLFGYLTARVDSFIRGDITREQLADDSAFMELCRTLVSRCTAQELYEIASGTRELPGEDVQSVQ